jgi:hypothetical protein
MSNVELSYRKHEQKNEIGETTGEKFCIVISAGGHVLTTPSFFGDESFINSELHRVKSAIESGNVTISTHKTSIIP